MNKRYCIFLAVLICIATAVRSQKSSISDAEAISFGQHLDAELRGGHATALFDAVDSAAFYAIVVAGSPTAQMPGFMEGFHKGFSLTRLSGPLQEAVNKGSFRLLHTYEKQGNRHLLFRLMPERGFNYYDCTLTRTGRGLRILDIYVYMNGETMSATLINIIDAMAGSIKETGELTKFETSFANLKVLKSKGDWPGVKAAFDSLDENLRHNKSIAMYGLIASQHLGKAAYKQSLETYAAYFPAATNAYFLMVDMYAVNGEYEKALGAIDKIDSMTDRDPALDYLRGIQYTYMNKKDSAFSCFNRVYTYDPSLHNNVKKLINAYLDRGEKEKALGLVKTYEKTPGAKKEIIDGWYAELPGLK